jgi:hypothetical protein
MEPLEDENDASVETVDDGYYTPDEFKRREDLEAEGVASQIWTGGKGDTMSQFPSTSRYRQKFILITTVFYSAF